MPNVCAYEGGRGVKNSKNHAYVVYGWSLIWNITFRTDAKQICVLAALLEGLKHLHSMKLCQKAKHLINSYGSNILPRHYALILVQITHNSLILCQFDSGFECLFKKCHSQCKSPDSQHWEICIFRPIAAGFRDQADGLL